MQLLKIWCYASNFIKILLITVTVIQTVLYCRSSVLFNQYEGQVMMIAMHFNNCLQSIIADDETNENVGHKCQR